MRIRRLMAPYFVAALFAAAALGGAELSSGVERALVYVSAGSLRSHVSFLASDSLQGRDTPSAGLDMAARYIASQFRREGLEPAGDDGYFETAAFVRVKPNVAGFKLTIEAAGPPIRVPVEHVTLAPVLNALEISRAPVLKIAPGDTDAIQELTAGQVRGKVLLTSAIWGFRILHTLHSAVPAAKPALVIVLTPSWPLDTGVVLVDSSATDDPPLIEVNDRELAKAYEALESGATGATVTYHQAACSAKPVKLRNVAGILRGSDPALKDTYVLVTAHYDHLGICADAGDRICNGANDDASGTASVIELAEALSHLRPPPKRSILFLTFFGEEKGLLGSRYYVRHPILPLEKTVADINLEQLGRTDDSEGPQVARASLTGFDYTDVGAVFEQAGRLTGVTVSKRGKNSDSYFARSDNQSFADVGIPAHTIVVAYEFPDYHQPGDKWTKLDYANMQKVDRMIGLGVLMLANDSEPPKWNEANRNAAPYARAGRKRQATQ